jgi:hypothetical protein
MAMNYNIHRLGGMGKAKSGTGDNVDYQTYSIFIKLTYIRTQI